MCTHSVCVCVCGVIEEKRRRKWRRSVSAVEEPHDLP